MIKRICGPRRSAGAYSTYDERELRGILFDFDGTIAETERWGQRVAYNRAFADLGLDWHWDQDLYEDLLTVPEGVDRLHYYAARYHPQKLRRAVTVDWFEKLRRIKSAHFVAIAPTISFRPGVQRLIYEARLAGLRVAVASTALRDEVESLLAQDSAIPEMVDVIVPNEAFERERRRANPYALALARLQLPPEACIAIEDSPTGLQSALALQIATVITISEYTTFDDFDGATAVLSGLGDYDSPVYCYSGMRPPAQEIDLAYLRSVFARQRRI